MKEKFRRQPENPKQYAPEAGAGPLGLPPPNPEQTPQGGDSRSPERRQLSSLWDVLEGQSKIHEERSSNRMTRQEYNCERSKLIGLEDEIGEKGTRRDRLIIGLYNTMTLETTGTFPNPLTFRELSLQEFQQFRSKVEPMSNEEITEEIRKAEEEFERKSAAKPIPDFPKGGPRV